MKKTIFICVILSMSTVVFANTITFDGRPAPLSRPVNFIEGYSFAPMREVFSILGAEVEWDQDTKTVTAKKQEREVAVTIGSASAFVNGEEVTMDAPARIDGGVTYVPVRFIATALGYNVNWSADSKTIVIETPKPPEAAVTVAYSPKYSQELTYEEAYAKAEKANTDLRTFIKNIDDIRKARDALAQEYTGLMTTSSGMPSYTWEDAIKAMSNSIETMTATVDTKPYTEEIMKGGIGASVESGFLAIEMAQNKIGTTAGQIELSKRALDNSALMLELGMISNVDYDEAKLTHEQLIEAQKINQEALEVEFVNLNRLMNENAENRYNIVIERTYEPFDNSFLIDDFIWRKMQIDPNIKLAEIKVEQAEIGIKHYLPGGAQTYDQAKTAVETATFELQDAKLNLEKNIRNAYASLKNLETQIKSVELDLGKANVVLDKARVQYSLGNITELQLLQAIYAVEMAEASISTLKSQYDVNRFMFDKPYLLR